ncbi:YonK family protein [Paraliobacillus ryukyuensis]|uniref:YonK family protein n=1 Tax=Paraliobacillus ryukyuensis TaxID=200904 RepID=UPI0009A61240|nr:YonK family protein [Paraliobacillus ryukyuensis]
MADYNHTISFKKSQLDLEEGTITEFKRDSTLTYRLLDELKKFEGEGRLIDLTIKEVTELEPSEE